MNPWTDIEKCIFLDRFLQDPKDFHKISKSLRNKTTKDCVEFYYNSKKSIPYKAALREYHMRKKRRGDISWDATIQAAVSVGAIITDGPSQEKPVLFSLVENDNTYYTHHLHPMKKDLFYSLEKEVNSTTETDVTSLENGDGNLFTVDDIKFLRTVSSGDLNQHSIKKRKEEHSDNSHTNIQTREYSKGKENESSKMLSSNDKTNQSISIHQKNQITKKATQIWSEPEKKKLYESIKNYGESIFHLHASPWILILQTDIFSICAMLKGGIGKKFHL